MIFSFTTYKFIIVAMAKCFRHEKEIEEQPILETDSTKATSSESGHDENSATVGCENKMGTKFMFGQDQNTWNSSGVQFFTGCPRRQEVPHAKRILLLLPSFFSSS
jgi:hypothetical protein